MILDNGRTRKLGFRQSVISRPTFSESRAGRDESCLKSNIREPPYVAIMPETSSFLGDFSGIALRLASPETITQWSYGEITKPETINYRTGRPERDGLFDERIFGPTKDWECYCGKYRRIRYKGVVCDKCGVEVTRAIVRRERMGHIKLAAPVSHIWFLRGVPSKIGLMLDISVANLEKVIYFAGYIITKVNEEARQTSLEEIEHEFK